MIIYSATLCSCSKGSSNSVKSEGGWCGGATNRKDGAIFMIAIMGRTRHPEYHTQSHTDWLTGWDTAQTTYLYKTAEREFAKASLEHWSPLHIDDPHTESKTQFFITLLTQPKNWIKHNSENTITNWSSTGTINTPCSKCLPFSADESTRHRTLFCTQLFVIIITIKSRGTLRSYRPTRWKRKWSRTLFRIVVLLIAKALFLIRSDIHT